MANSVNATSGLGPLSPGSLDQTNADIAAVNGSTDNNTGFIDSLFGYLGQGLNLGTQAAGTYQAWTDPAAYTANQALLNQSKTPPPKEKQDNTIMWLIFGGIGLFGLGLIIYFVSRK